MVIVHRLAIGSILLYLCETFPHVQHPRRAPGLTSVFPSSVCGRLRQETRIDGCNRGLGLYISVLALYISQFSYPFYYTVKTLSENPSVGLLGIQS